MNHESLPIIGSPARLATLRRLGLLDATASQALDRLTRLAARVLRVPIALVSFVEEERQFFKSAIGLAEPWAARRETPRSHSFCQYVIESGEPLIVADAREHPLLYDNPAIADMDVIAYAGMPLILHDGQRLGTFCVIDHQPRSWTQEEIQILSDLAASALTEIELLADQIENARLLEQTKLAEERQRLLLEQIPCRLWTTDRDLRYTSLIGLTARELQSEPESLIGMSIYEFFGTDDPQLLPVAAHHRALAGQPSTYDIVRNSRVFQTHVQPFRDTQGQIIGCIGVALDITERRRAEVALRESEERARRLSEVAFEGIAIHNQEIIVDANQALASILGYEHAEIIGMPVLHFVAPESRDLIVAHLRSGTTQPYEVIGLRKDGTRIMAEIQARPIVYEGKSLRVAAIRDITARKQAEAALRESEERYRTFFEHSIDAILLTAPDGSIFAANPAACRIFGRSEAEICQIGRNGLVDTDDPRLAAALEQRARTGSFKGEMTYIHRDGTRFPGELSTALFKDRDGLTKTSMIIRDITERKRAEEALWASQKLLQGIVDHAPMTIVIQDVAEGRYLLVNRSLTATTGRSVEQLLGKTLAELYPPECVAVWRAQDREIARTHQALQVEDDVRHSDGSLHTSLGIKFPLYDSKGDVYAIGGIFTDITERKRAEQEREQLIGALQEALANIKTLRGLLPICAACKKIRDDSGYWSQIEGYVQAHSDAVFSHSICPDCARRLYGDILEE